MPEGTVDVCVYKRRHCTEHGTPPESLLKDNPSNPMPRILRETTGVARGEAGDRGGGRAAAAGHGVSRDLCPELGSEARWSLPLM